MPNKDKQLLATIDPGRINSLYDKATSYIDRAKLVIQQTVNVEMIKAYWLIAG